MRIIKKQKSCTLLVLVISIISHYTSFAQNEAKEYKKALKYILNDNKGKSIAVSDTITHLSYFSFGNQIDTVWGIKDDIVSHILDSVDRARENYKSVFTEFKNLEHATSGPVYIIFFSDFYSNMVIGEIIPQRNKKRAFDHSVQASFNRSKQYLFIFDKKHSLKKVYASTMNYD